MDLKTGGYQEFVTVDAIGVWNMKFVLVVEVKKFSIGESKKEYLLAIKDIGDRNGGGAVCSFVTTGELWKMIRYEGQGFTRTCNFLVMSKNMEQEQEKWMKEFSFVVDCIHVLLRGGGCVIHN